MSSFSLEFAMFILGDPLLFWPAYGTDEMSLLVYCHILAIGQFVVSRWLSSWAERTVERLTHLICNNLLHF